MDKDLKFEYVIIDKVRNGFIVESLHDDATWVAKKPEEMIRLISGFYGLTVPMFTKEKTTKQNPQVRF